jgi:hypothetical protein
MAASLSLTSLMPISVLDEVTRLRWNRTVELRLADFLLDERAVMNTNRGLTARGATICCESWNRMVVDIQP